VIKFLAMIALALASPAQAPVASHRAPSVDLSAVRYILCKVATPKGPAFYTGSAFMIADHVIATARHVAHGDTCMDVASGTEVKMYHEDTTHDFALMSAPGLPTNIPYLKYRCDGIKPNKPYLSYGITDYDQDVPILRENTIYSTNKIVKDDDAVDDFPHSAGMREFNGFIAPGMSGGPVTDIDGYVVAVNNAGSDTDTLLFDLKDTVLCKK
jgi:hypothetical protein